MTAPVDDEIDVGHDPRARAPWHDWSTRTRRLVGALAVVVVLVVGVLWFLGRDPAPAPPAAAPPVPVGAPGADVTVDLAPSTDACPVGATCRYDDTLSAADEAVFRDSFGSAGYIGRQSVRDTATGEVYLQLVRFTTGTLVTITLTQQPVDRLPTPPVVSDVPAQAERGSGSVTVSAVRDGYLMTATAAGLPGQPMPVRSVQQWVRTVPAP